MFIPSIQFQQSIQDIQSKFHGEVTEVKIANSGAIPPKVLEHLNQTVEKINSQCQQILSLLSSHDISQPESFSPAEKFRLELLNSKVMQEKDFLESMLTFRKNFVLVVHP